MRRTVLFLALLAVGRAVAFAQSDADHIGLYLDAQATDCTGILDAPGQVVAVKVLAVLRELAAPIIAVEFCLENLPPSGGEGGAMWIADWGTALVLGDPLGGLALAWTEPQPGPIVELGTITFYSQAAADWIGPDHTLRVRPSVTFGTPVSVVTEDGATVPVAGAAFFFNCSDPGQCLCWEAGSPVCAVSATALDFGERYIGSVTERSFTVSNSGTRPLTGTVSLDSSGDFMIVTGAGPFALDVGEVLEIKVHFLPVQAGPAVATLSLGTANCPALACTGIAVPRVPGCEINCEFTDFGTVALGDFRRLAITLHNPGTGVLHVGIPGGENGFLVWPGQTGYHSVLPGANLVLRVDFQPTAVGPASWTLDVGSEYCSPLHLTGTGRESNAICELDPPSLDFAGVEIGDWRDQQFTLRNLGTDRFVMRAWNSCGSFTLQDTYIGWVVFNPGAEKTFTVRFGPWYPGAVDCEFDLHSVPCANLPVSGIGADALACLVAPGILDFGPVGVGYASVLAFTVTNESGTPFWCEIPELNGQFTTLAGAGPILLGAGETHVVQVRFAPTALGQHAVNVAFGDCPCAVMTLRGRGREPVTACTLTPTALDFGTVGIGAYAERGFTIINAGDVDLQCDVADATGPFTTVAGAGAHLLARGESLELRVRFTPEASGLAAAELPLGAGPCPAISLSGIGREAIMACALSPATWDYGTVWLGERESKAFSLTNTGDYQISGDITVDAPGFAILAGGGPFNLAPSATRDFIVQFVPVAHGQHAAGVSFGEASCPDLALTGYGFRHAGGDDRIGIFADPDGTICALDAPVGDPILLRILAVVPDFAAEGITGASFRLAGLEALTNLAAWDLSWTWPPVAGEPETGLRFEFPPATGGLVELGQIALTALQAIPGDQQLQVDLVSLTHDLTISDSAGDEWDVNGGLFTLSCETPVLCPCAAGSTPVVLSDFSVECQGDRAVLRWATGGALDAEFRLVGAAQGSEWELAHVQESDGSYRAEDPRWGEQGGARVDYRLFGRLPGEDWQLLREASLASPAVAGPARLLAPHPNPFNPSVTIPFRLPAPQRVRLLVHDVAGRQVALLADREFPAGEHALVWDGRDIEGRSAGTGVYFVRLEAAGVSESQKLVLLR